MRLLAPTSVFCLLLASTSVFADAHTEQAIRKAAEAASKTPAIKKCIKNLERVVTSALPVEKETAATIGSTVIAVVSGKVDTKPIKNLKMRFIGGTLRPDFEYKFYDGEVTSNLQMNWEW